MPTLISLVIRIKLSNQLFNLGFKIWRSERGTNWIEGILDRTNITSVKLLEYLCMLVRDLMMYIQYFTSFISFSALLKSATTTNLVIVFVQYPNLRYYKWCYESLRICTLCNLQQDIRDQDTYLMSFRPLKFWQHHIVYMHTIYFTFYPAFLLLYPRHNRRYYAIGGILSHPNQYEQKVAHWPFQQKQGNRWA